MTARTNRTAKPAGKSTTKAAKSAGKGATKAAKPAGKGATKAAKSTREQRVVAPDAKATKTSARTTKRTSGSTTSRTVAGGDAPTSDPVEPVTVTIAATGGEVVRVERSGGEWRDLNKEMFYDRIRLREEIDRLKAEGATDPAKRRMATRREREFEDLTIKIIESNYGLLRKYVRLFTGSATREDAKDFEAAGRLGLMRAIDNYDPNRGSFAQWAFKPIQREVLRAVHSADHANMNPGDFERRPDILRALKKLQGENEEHRPSDAEVAAEAKVTIEQVKRVLNAPRMDSLYTPVGDGDATLGELIVDKSAAVDDTVVNAIGVEALENYGLSALDAREYFVLSRRLGLDCEPEQRLSAIGEMLQLSREAVRQIESKAIAKLSHPVLLRQLVREGK